MSSKNSLSDSSSDSEDAPPRVVCEDCSDPITYLGKHTGQPTTAVGMVTGTGQYVCGCAEPPEKWEIRYETPKTGSQSDPTYMHPDGCRCERCLKE